MTTNKNVLVKHQLYVKQWILFLIIFLSCCTCQKRNDGQHPVVTPVASDKPIFVNDISSNSKFRMGLVGSVGFMRTANSNVAKSGTVVSENQLKCAQEDGSVKFPNPPNMTPSTRTNLKVEIDKFKPLETDIKKCESDPFACNETTYYPKNLFRQQYPSNNLLKLYSICDELPGKVDKVDTRFDSAADTGGKMKQFCGFKVTLHFPKLLKNKENEHRFIIQDPEFNLTQSIRVETCEKPGDNRCGSLVSYITGSLKMECVQKYGYRQLAAIDAKGNVVMDAFQIPTCCVCMYT